jgi:hypothetical protein
VKVIHANPSRHPQTNHVGGRYFQAERQLRFRSKEQLTLSAVSPSFLYRILYPLSLSFIRDVLFLQGGYLSFFLPFVSGYGHSLSLSHGRHELLTLIRFRLIAHFSISKTGTFEEDLNDVTNLFFFLFFLSYEIFFHRSASSLA